MPANPAVHDVLIAGAGAVGLALAGALKQALGDRIAVAVVDPARQDGDGRLRTVALSTGSRGLLGQIGAWEAIEAVSQPILEMAITDGRVGDAVRPTHLRFDAADGGEPLAHMAFNDDLVASLRAVCDRLGVGRIAASVESFASRRAAAEVALSDGQSTRARLVVAADGARSRLRGLADIPAAGWDYDQAGLVTTIAHEREHRGRAEQHFLPAGPFAILPLPGRRSSIVWNESRADASAILRLSPEAVVAELERRFTPTLGALSLESRLESFPFRFQIARRFIGERLALIGDAAHLVHPLAGQGLNIGLRDVAALAEIVVERMRLGLDPGDSAPLEAYQRARRFDAAASGLGMDAMNRLFSNDAEPLRFARDLGLRVVDRLPRLKDAFVAEAGGGVRGAPRLLRGLAL